MPANPPSAAPLDLDAPTSTKPLMPNTPLDFDERVVRHENGHLVIERVPLPDEERIAKLFASISKAWPVLAQHASHMDGEFDLAVCDLRRVVKFLVAAARRGVEDTARIEWLEKHANPVHAAVLSFPAKVRDGATGRSFEAESIREAIDAARAHPPIQETDDEN